MTRSINSLTAEQRSFGSQFSEAYGNWTVTSGSADRILRAGDGPYNLYIPNSLDSLEDAGNVLDIRSTGVSDITVESDLISVTQHILYSMSILVSASQSASATLDVEFYDTEEAVSPLASAEPLQVPFGGNLTIGEWSTFTGPYVAPPGSNYARIIIVFSGQNGDPVVSGDTYHLYDPVFFDDREEATGDFSRQIYENTIPSFMVLDDEGIDDLAGDVQPLAPLRRYVESLCRVADLVTDQTNLFYTLQDEGEYTQLSRLTDPLTASPAWLPWLASLTGTKLLVASGGFTPWLVLEDYDPASPPSPGEWEDIETLASWSILQDLDPDFFDNVAGFRNQIYTGFSGIHGGRLDVAKSYLLTILDAETVGMNAATLVPNHLRSPHRLKVLVDPDVDPDPSGALVADGMSQGLPAGSTIIKVSQVLESGTGRIDTDELATVGAGASAKGMKPYEARFVDDKDGHGHHIKLVSESADPMDLGGGIGTSTLVDGSAYYYGHEGSLVTDGDALLDMGGASVGFDFIVGLSDIQLEYAPLSTAVNTNPDPEDWKFRTKQLIACGLSDGGDNDWAVYLASGLTPSASNDVRLLYVDGYAAPTATNYAYSDPIDFPTGLIFLRVSKTTGGDVTFYVQDSLYGDWENNSVGGMSITGTAASGGASSKVQLAGILNNSEWSDAGPLSAIYHSLRVWNAPIVFNGEDEVSATGHAYVGGGDVLDFGTFDYLPTLDMRISVADIHADTFTGLLSSGSSVTVNVNTTSSNDNDMYVGLPNGSTPYWYFGESYGTSNGDTLTVTGLPSSTYSSEFDLVDVSDGSVTTETFHTAVAATTTLEFNADDFSEALRGATVEAIRVTDDLNSDTVEGDFLPTTIADGSLAGDDTHGATWTLVRSYPTGGTYIPSQKIDRALLHPYEGALDIGFAPKLELHSEFSIAMVLRRHWNSGTHTIITQVNGDDAGFELSYSAGNVVATFSDGTTTETATVAESVIGEWNSVIVTRDPRLGLTLDVNGITDTAATAASLTFVTEPDVFTLSEGAADTYTAKFALSHFTIFRRALNDVDKALLLAQLP